jgi:RNA polymerase-interacting CarD/CdnL/TRCF family regulator
VVPDNDSLKTMFKKGNFLVKFGKIYKISDKEEKIVNNKKKTVLYYKRYKPKNDREKITCSIPLSNLDKAKIRKPLSKSKLKEFIELLKKNMKTAKKINVNRSKDAIYTNEIEGKAGILKRLWLEKRNPDKKLSYSKKQLFSRLIDSITEEMAFIFNISTKKAEKKIISALDETELLDKKKKKKKKK